MEVRVWKLNPVLAFLYWQMNYHVEHHMYAAVPFYNLKKLHLAIAHDCPAPKRGLIDAWREMFEAMRKQKADPPYHCQPVLPETAQRYKEA